MKTATALSEPIFLKGNQFWKPWEQRVQTASKSLRTAGKKDERQVEVDFSIFTPKDYLLSHATIVGGVEPEENGYWITPTHNQWVNDNGNAWSNQVLLESYRSFIMAENYLEHIQLKELSKGKVLDAVAWVVRQKDKNKKEIPTVFIDILVATDKKKHPKLVEKIQSGKLSTLSMGCLPPWGLVTLADGTQRRIDQIIPGDYVLTAEGRVRKVKNVQIKQVKEKLYSLQIAGNGKKEKLQLTGEHPLPSWRLQKDKAKRAQGRRALKQNCVVAYGCVEGIESYDYVEQVHPQEIWLNPEITETAAELLGMLAGDGVLHDNENHNVGGVIELLVNKVDEVEIAERGRELLQDFTGGDICEYPHKESSKVAVLKKGCDKKVKFLRRFLLGRNAREKRFSAEVLYWPENLQRAVLRGYFNADGDFNSKTLKAESRSKDLRDQIALMLYRQGLPASTLTNPHKPTGFSKEPYLMYVVNVPRSFVEPWMSLKVPRGYVGKKQERETFQVQGKFLRLVKNVGSTDYEGEVYNLEIEGDHTFSASGIHVHNCDISHSQCSRCGGIFEEGEDQCEHLEGMLNHHFRDSKGNKHRIAELCGVAGWEGSCDYIEASWVLIPAWEPAKRHSGIKIGQAWMGKPLRAYVPASRMNDAAREAGWLN